MWHPRPLLCIGSGRQHLGGPCIAHCSVLWNHRHIYIVSSSRHASRLCCVFGTDAVWCTPSSSSSSRVRLPLRWATQAGYGAVTGDDDGEDSDSDSDDEGATGRRSKNGAFLVWQGTASRKTFSAFSFEECHSVDKARSYLAKRNCAHFFDQCLNYQPA